MFVLMSFLELQILLCLCFCSHIIYRDINVKFDSSVLMRLQHFEGAKCPHLVCSGYVCLMTFSRCSGTPGTSWVIAFLIFRNSCMQVLCCFSVDICQSRICISTGLHLSWVSSGKPWVQGTFCLCVGIVVKVKNAADCSVTLKG